MNLEHAAKASSGFINPPAGRKWYISSISQTNLSFVSSQLEPTPLGKGSAERFHLPLRLCVAFPFPFVPRDRWGP